MKKRAVIFDFDGVIGDTFKESKDVVLELYKERLGQEAKSNDIKRLMNLDIKEVIKELRLSPKQLPSFQKACRQGLSKRIDGVKIFKGIKNVLVNLKKEGYVLGILSSNSRENLDYLLKKNDIDFFNFIYSGSATFGKGKVLTDLLKGENLFPQKTVYIGDEERDIQAARENKVISLVVGWGYEKLLKEKNPDYFVNKPKDLLKIIKKLC